MSRHAVNTSSPGKRGLRTALLWIALIGPAGCDTGSGSAAQGDIDLTTGTRVVFEPGAAVDTDTPSAKHDIAGRSAFPAVGETLDKPIAYKRLSNEAQFALPIDPADIPAVVRWQDASKYVGYEITVQGRIVGVGQSRDGKVNFLNFHEDYRGKFYMVIFDDLAKTLDQSVEALFKGEVVRVKGKVDTHRNNPQMKITSMDQVEFVGE
ncbi:MAG: OB-fold nucleic acid binding domain-containing protein [Phycisphaeraceae bacterium]